MSNSHEDQQMWQEIKQKKKKNQREGEKEGRSHRTRLSRVLPSLPSPPLLSSSHVRSSAPLLRQPPTLSAWEPTDAATVRVSPLPFLLTPLIILLSPRLHTASIHPFSSPPTPISSSPTPHSPPTLSFGPELFFFFPPPTPFPSGVQKRQVLVGRESEGLCNLWLPMSKGELLLRPRKVNITQVWVVVVVAEVGGALPEDANFLFSSGGEARGDIWKAGAE